jgi:hypothetical protein
MDKQILYIKKINNCIELCLNKKNNFNNYSITYQVNYSINNSVNNEIKSLLLQNDIDFYNKITDCLIHCMKIQ